MSWGPLVSYTLTVTGMGSITSSPAGISVPCFPNPSCSATFADGTAVTLTATPPPGQIFSGWGGACSGTGPCTVSMIGDRSVTASFACPLLLATELAGAAAAEVVDVVAAARARSLSR
jgi:hypothetical protein